MVYEYILDHLKRQLDPPYNFSTTVEAVNKLVDLHGYAAELHTHWSTLDDDDRFLESDLHQSELDAIEKLKTACVNNLERMVRMNESERVTELAEKLNALRIQADHKEMELKAALKEVQDQAENRAAELKKALDSQSAQAENHAAELKKALESAQADDNLVVMKTTIPYDEFHAEFSKLWCYTRIVKCLLQGIGKFHRIFGKK